MLKKHWKSGWLLTSLVLLALLLASSRNASERKAYGEAASAAHRDVQVRMLDKLSAAKPKVIGPAAFFLERQIYSVLAYINQVADIVARSKTHRPAPELLENLALAVNKILEKHVEIRYQTDSEIVVALKQCVVKAAKA